MNNIETKIKALGLVKKENLADKIRSCFPEYATIEQDYTRENSLIAFIDDEDTDTYVIVCEPRIEGIKIKDCFIENEVSYK